MTTLEPVDVVGPADVPAAVDHDRRGGDGGGARRRPPVRRRARQAATVAFAAAVAAGVGLALRHAYPDRLTGRTDVVGHPTFADFDVRVYFVNYFLVVLVCPAVAVAVYAVVTALVQRRRRIPVLPATTAAAPPDDPDPAAHSWPVALGRAGFVGLVLGLAVVITIGASAHDVAPVAVGVAVAHTAAVTAAGLAAQRLAAARGAPARPLAVVAATNALVAPAALLALVAASDATRVVVARPPEVVDYPWFPLPVGLAALAAGVALVAWQLRRVAPERWPAVERWAVLLGPAPVAVYLFSSALGMSVGGMDVFHEGEVLVATRRVVGGDLPWRDVLFIHGLMGDVVPGLAARAFFGDSRWAALAVGGPLLVPVYWVGNYLLCLSLFRRNWLLLAASQVLVVLGTVRFFHFRMLLLPYLLLALGAVLRKPTWPRAAALALVATAQFVLAPEASYFSAAAGAVVVVFDVVHRRPGVRLADAFARTSRTAVVALAAAAVFLAGLVATGSVGAFLDYYRTFASGHELSGGLPIAEGDRTFHFWMVAPVALVLVAWAYGAARVGSRRWFTVPDWVVAAGVLGLLPYYVKFLSRAEVGHLSQVAATAVVPLLYVGYRLVDGVEAPLRRARPWAWPVSAAVLAAAVVLSPVSARAVVEGIPGRWVDVTDHRSPVARVGFEDRAGLEGPDGTLGVVDPRVVDDLDVVLDAYLGPDGKVFDFTNSPGMFGYLLDHPNATRYFHVSMAKPESAQRDLVAELARERPEIVVLDSTEYGLPGWDHVPNVVRHYLVSEWLLDHYEPALGLHGFSLYRREDVPEVPAAALAPQLSEAPLTDDLRLGPRACTWGYAPSFLALRPEAAPGSGADADAGADAGAGRVGVAVGPAGPMVSAQGWAVDGRTRTPVREVLAVVDGRVVHRMTTGGLRPDVAQALGAPAAEPSGFGATFPLPAGVSEAGDVRLYGVTATGEAGEISRGEGWRPSPDRGLVDPGDGDRGGGAVVPVVPGVAVGAMDHLVELSRTYELDLPAGARDHDWLRVETARPLVDDRLTLDDPTGIAAHSITFGTLEGRGDPRSVDVLVGSCPQWQAYDPDEPLLLRTEAGVDITRVELIGRV